MKVLAYKIEILNNNEAIGKMVVEDINKDDTLHEMYRVIGCDCVAVRSFKIEGHLYDVWFDDEFMLKSGQKCPSVLLTANEGWSDKVLICGNVMFARADNEGRTIGLNDNDIKRLKMFVPKNVLKAVKYMMALMSR